MARLNDNIQKGFGEITQKQTEIKSLNSNIDKLKIEHGIVAGKVSDQESEKKRLEDIITRQNDRLGLLEDQIRNFNIKIHKKDEQIFELNRQIDLNKGEYKGLQIAFQTKQNEY